MASGLVHASGPLGNLYGYYSFCSGILEKMKHHSQCIPRLKKNSFHLPFFPFDSRLKMQYFHSFCAVYLFLLHLKPEGEDHDHISRNHCGTVPWSNICLRCCLPGCRH
jgi:hypothetical protein